MSSAGFSFVWDDDTASLPPLHWLVHGQIPSPSLSVVVAPKESGKTAWAIGLALCIGSGTPHFGAAVEQGLVVYIYAEGRTGLHRRVQAWKAANRINRKCNVLFLPTAVQLLDEMKVEALTRAIEGYGRPTLIVVDTIGRNTPGGDENATSDQSRLVFAADKWREHFGASTMLIGHPTKARGKSLRGSEAIENAADTIIRLEREGDRITFTCEKQRDDEHFASFSLQLTPYAGGIVLTQADAASSVAKVTPMQLQALQCLNDISPSLGCSNSTWERSCTQDGGMSVRTFWSSKKRLLALGYIEEVRGGKGFIVSQTGAGFLRLQLHSNSTAIAVQAPTASPAAPLKGQGVAGPVRSQVADRHLGAVS